MTAFLELYRKLDFVQRTRRFHVVATVIAVALCGVVFGSLLAVSHATDRERVALVTALAGQNLEQQDEYAVSLKETGTVTVDGKTYGGDRYRRNADIIFDDAGNIRSPAALVERMLNETRPWWAPRWMLQRPSTTWMLAALTVLWLVLIIWMDISVPFALTLVGTLVPAGLAWLLGATQLALALAGMGLLTFTWILLTRVVLFLFNRPNQVLAVAHTVIKEASRNRISLVFIVLLLVVLPLLPLWLDPDSPLRFQLQTFIARSMGITFFLTACMTLFLACASVAFEIRDRQIWQLMTKPMNRLHYLLGKWVGVVTVNLVLLIVSGVSIFTFVQYLRERPVAAGLEGQIDAMAVQSEVLTARSSRRPQYDVFDATQLSARVDQFIQRRPELARMEEVPLETIRDIESGLQQAYLTGQRTVPPRAGRDYVFRGLQAARDPDKVLTLRYCFYIMRSDAHETYPAIFMFNGDPNLRVSRTYVPTMSHVLPVPARLIRDDGTLTVTIYNSYQPPASQRQFGALNFEIEDFEILYEVGSFEANFLRAVAINWIKLSFLAMLGVCCSTFLSFSVSCLLSFTVFVSGMLGPFLADSLLVWFPPATSQMDWSNVGLVIRWAFQWSVLGIGEFLVWSLSSFGEISATERLVQGKFISWGEVIQGFFKLGILWSGAALVTGFIVIRSRQLAIYSGQG